MAALEFTELHSPVCVPLHRHWLLIQFRRQGHSPGKTIIHNNEAEIVSKYKYLGTIFDKLKWDDNTEEIVKKGQQRLYLLPRKLNYFSVDQKVLTLFFFFFLFSFYKSFLESVLSFSFICWFHSVGAKNRNGLQRIVRIASKITAVPQRDLALLSVNSRSYGRKPALF